MGKTNEAAENRLAQDRAEFLRRKKEREEAHLYTNIGVLTEKTFQSHHGFDLTSNDLPAEDPAQPTQYRVLRTKKVSEFAQEIAEERGLKAENIRFWVMVNRQNKTARPDQLITDPEISVEEAYTKLASKGNLFRLWLEYSPDGQWNDSPDSILIFLKHFDVVNQTLSGVGSVHVKKTQKVSELASTILSKMNWPQGTDFILFEEIKHSMIDLMKPKQTFQQSEIQNGDIITFQRQVKEADLPPTALYTDARQFYDYLLSRMDVRFAPIGTSEGEDFTLTLSRKMTYDQFSKKVAEHLNVEPTHIRFAPVVQSTAKPKAFLKRNPATTLASVLSGQYGSYGGYNAIRPDALYYEVLDMSLSDFESKKSFRVTLLPEGISKEETVEVLVARTGTVSELLSALQVKAKLDDETMKVIRLYEALNGKFSKELRPEDQINTVTDYGSIFAERIPAEELNMEADDRLISAFNFEKEPTRPHGAPFKFVVKPVSDSHSVVIASS